MRLRRLELVVIGLTLAFSCFIGGYFVGRGSGSVNISPTISQHDDSLPTGVATTAPAPTEQVSAGSQESGGTQSQGAGGTQQGAAQATPTPPARDSDGRININLASRNELMDLPGIGPTLSDRIVDYRTANGPFSKIEDIRNVSGIGEKRFETIKDKITVGIP